MAGNFNISYIFNAVDKLTPVTKKISKSFDNVQKNTKKAGLVTESFSNKLQKVANKSNFANNSLVRLAAGYLSLNAAIGFGKSLINTQVQIQNINAGLKAVTGSQELATEEFEFAKKAADDIGVSFQSLILPYTKFLASSKLSREENRKVFTSFNKISRVFGLTAEQSGGIFRALEQIQNKGKVMSEELKLQLGDRLPAALQLFADASGKSTAEFTKLMEQGRVGAGLIPLVADLIEKRYGKAAADASNTLGASIARLDNAFFNLKSTTSTGFFSEFVIKSVVFLTNNMDKLFKIVVGIGIVFGTLFALKLPVMIASLVAQFALSSIAAAGLFKTISLFMLTNPFGILLTSIGFLIASLILLKENFHDVREAAKFLGERGRYSDAPVEKFFGRDKIDNAINATSTVNTLNTLGLNGTINIKGAPSGSTAEMSTSGNSSGNLGLNMSFAPGGL